MKKNFGKTNVKAIIVACALGVSMMFTVTACGSSSSTTDTSTIAESITTEDTAATEETTEADSVVADGTYTGKITAVTDTTLTIETMGQGAGNGDQMNADAAPSDMSGDKPSDAAPSDMSGDKPSDTAPSDMSGDMNQGEAPAGESMTFTVTADQITDLAEGDMVTITVENGTVTTVEKSEAANYMQAPTDAASESTTEEA